MLMSARLVLSLTFRKYRTYADSRLSRLRSESSCGTLKLHFRHAPRSFRNEITTGMWFAPGNFNSKLPLLSIS